VAPGPGQEGDPDWLKAGRGRRARAVGAAVRAAARRGR
jgi:hypothetical protein